MEARAKAIKAAQKQYERDSEAARRKRQKAFAKAREKGYSFSRIGELVGLSKSRIEQIVKGE